MTSYSLRNTVAPDRIILKFLAWIVVLLGSASAVSAADVGGTLQYASSSRLSSGRWVKIKVRDTGVHQITDRQLLEMGFTDPSRVAVYGFAAVELSDYAVNIATPDDLPPVPSVYRDGKLIFYGAGDVVCSVSGSTSGRVEVLRNHYADYGTYFLTDSALPVAPEESGEPSADGEAVSEAFGIVHIEEETGNSTGLGPYFFGKSFIDFPSQSYTLRMPGLLEDKTVNFDIESAFQVSSGGKLQIISPSGKERQMNVYSSDASSYRYYCHSYSWNETLPLSPSGEYIVNLDARNLVDMSFGALNYITALYPRSTDFGDTGCQQLYIFDNLKKGDNVVFSSVPSGACVWDVTCRGVPRALVSVAGGEENGGGNLVVASPSDYSTETTSPGYFVVFDPAGELLPVEFVEEVSSSDLHALPTPEMVIIAARSFMTEARQLADAHSRIDGLDVAVVCQDDIYNEFSSGTPHITALRRFVIMLCNRDPGRLRSVLLFGSASTDNRDKVYAERRSFRDTHIPIMLQERLSLSGHCSRSFATDSYVGMTSVQKLGEPFDIYSTHMDVNVSRIPVDNAGDAATVVDKTIRFMETNIHPVASNSALLCCDKGDGLAHMKDVEEIASLIAHYAPSTVIYKGYDPIFPQDNGNAAQLHRYITDSFVRGVSYWAYSGHSTPLAFGAEPVWSVGLIHSTEYDVAPFAVFATCRALYYDHQGNNLGEAALYNPRGGAIAVVGALREVYKDKNLFLHKELAKEFFTAGENATTGDVFRLARRSSVSTPDSQNDDQIINTLSYNMIGDPEVKIRRPRLRVEVASMNGEPFTPERPLSLDAVKPVRFEGMITDASGELAADFNGSVTMSLFDGKRTARVVNVGSASSENKWLGSAQEMADEIIYEKVADVVGGRFSFTASLPSPLRPGSENVITFAAVSPDGSKQATGCLGSVTVVPSESGYELSEENVPVITEMYLDTPSFADGDVVGSNVVFHATVGPNELGVAGTSAMLGQGIRLVLDGSRSFTDAAAAFVPDTGGGGTIDLPLDDIDDGNHTLTLRVKNYAGQASERTISFTTVSVSTAATLEVEEYPARERATINLSAPYADPVTGRIVIRNGMGEVVFTSENTSFPFEWSLCDNDGKPVPDGFYTAEVYYSSGLRHGFSGPATLVVYRAVEQKQE